MPLRAVSVTSEGLSLFLLCLLPLQRFERLYVLYRPEHIREVLPTAMQHYPLMHIVCYSVHVSTAFVLLSPRSWLSATEFLSVFCNHCILCSDKRINITHWRKNRMMRKLVHGALRLRFR